MLGLAFVAFVAPESRVARWAFGKMGFSHIQPTVLQAARWKGTDQINSWSGPSSQGCEGVMLDPMFITHLPQNLASIPPTPPEPTCWEVAVPTPLLNHEKAG
jgi:hypothetical protein